MPFGSSCYWTASMGRPGDLRASRCMRKMVARGSGSITRRRRYPRTGQFAPCRLVGSVAARGGGQLCSGYWRCEGKSMSPRAANRQTHTKRTHGNRRRTNRNTKRKHANKQHLGDVAHAVGARLGIAMSRCSYFPPWGIARWRIESPSRHCRFLSALFFLRLSCPACGARSRRVALLGSDVAVSLVMRRWREGVSVGSDVGMGAGPPYRTARPLRRGALAAECTRRRRCPMARCRCRCSRRPRARTAWGTPAPSRPPRAAGARRGPCSRR